ERMSGLLQAELGRRHFTPNADGDMERERDGVRVVVDPDTGDVTISAQMDEDRPPPPANDSPCGCRMAALLAAARKEAEAQAGLQHRVTAHLEGRLPKIGCELEGVSSVVTIAAVKEKAASLGEIVKVDEDLKAGTVTIVVAV